MDHSVPQQELVVMPGQPPDAAYGHGYQVPIQPDAIQGDGSDDVLRLVDYWHILKRRRGTLGLAAFLGLFVAFLITLPQARVYRARTTLEIQNVNSDFLNTKQINPVASEDSTMNVFTDLQTQTAILESEHLIDRVIEKLRADHTLGPAPVSHGPLTWLRNHLSMSQPKVADANYAFRKSAMASLSVNQIGQTRVIEILYKSSDPQFAANFLNALTSEYIESNMEARWKMSEHTSEWLASQLEGMREKLQRSETALQEYAQRAGLLYASPLFGGASEKTNVSEDKLRQVQEELSRAQADRAAAQSRYEVAKSAAPETLGDVLNDQSLRSLQSKLTDLRRQEAELITIYTAKHENVKMVEAQIKPLQAEFEQERAAIVARIRNDYLAAQGREELLAADYATQSQVVTEEAGKSIQYNILKREVDSNRQIYESMLQQVKEAGIASAIRASNIRVVDPAQIPLEPYSPNLILNSALGLMAGIFLGACFALVQERGDRSLQFPGETPRWTKLPELGVIPSGRLEAPTIGSTYGRFLPRFGPPSPFGSRVPRKMDLIAATSKSGIIAEAFRTVLASIIFVGENGNRPRVLAFTSDGPADGKTTTVSNLAVVASEVQRKVLIIDADLRRPRMHELFGASNEFGLGDLLRVDTLDESTIGSLIQETFTSNVYLLPSGPALPSASHLLYSHHLPLLLAWLKKQFDLVLIDTPPVLQAPDARIVGRHVDAVVLVARAGNTTRDAIMAVRQRFSEDGTRVLGTILNDWHPDDSPDGYRGYYVGANSGSKKSVLSRYLKQSNN